MSSQSTVQPSPSSATELIRVENLQVHFPLYEGQLRRRKRGVARAVDGVSFSLRQGESLALVGAASCGKSTVARALGLLERPTSGRILFQGQDMTSWRGSHFKRARRRIQTLFSNPYTAFAPRASVQDIIAEALDLDEHRLTGGRDQRMAELMTAAGLNLYLSVRFPRDLSGGNRQRLAIARALAARPTLLICDQPTAHIEPAVGDAVIDLLHDLRQQSDLTMLLTARRLDTARHVDRIAIMVLGRVVEMGYRADLLRRPLHPFTQALLRPPSGEFFDTVSQALDPLRPAPGCHYAPVCPLAEEQCRVSYPAFVAGAANHGVACHKVSLFQSAA